MLKEEAHLFGDLPEFEEIFLSRLFKSWKTDTLKSYKISATVSSRIHKPTALPHMPYEPLH